MKKVLMISFALLLLCAAGSVLAAGSGLLGPYEGYYRLINVYPDNDETPFSEDLQGIAHDDDNWYITQKEYLWKIPVGIDFNNFPNEEDWGAYGIYRIGIPAELSTLLYDHYGDLTYYQGKLIMPIECVADISPKPGPAFVIFRASDLQLLGFEAISTPDGSWAAVYPDSNGRVYTARTWHDVRYLSTYDVTWDYQSISPPDIGLVYTGDIELRNTDGITLTIHESQGGAFSESGDYLFILTGGTSTSEDECGVHVFDTHTWRRVARSYPGDPLFAFECHTGEKWMDESEGITVWDLDDGRAPGIRGQLHAIQIDVDVDTDDLYLHHYTGNIYVDQAYGGLNPNGFILSPFLLVSQASGLAWPGAKIHIQTGVYSEAVNFSGHIQINSRGGGVTIGPDGNLMLSDSGMINLGGNGYINIP